MKIAEELQTAVAQKYPDVRRFHPHFIDGTGDAVGWTFSITDHYDTGYGWITVEGDISATEHELRPIAADDLRDYVLRKRRA